MGRLASPHPVGYCPSHCDSDDAQTTSWRAAIPEARESSALGCVWWQNMSHRLARIVGARKLRGPGKTLACMPIGRPYVGERPQSPRPPPQSVLTLGMYALPGPPFRAVLPRRTPRCPGGVPVWPRYLGCPPGRRPVSSRIRRQRHRLSAWVNHDQCAT